MPHCGLRLVLVLGPQRERARRLARSANCRVLPVVLERRLADERRGPPCCRAPGSARAVACGRRASSLTSVARSRRGASCAADRRRSRRRCRRGRPPSGRSRGCSTSVPSACPGTRRTGSSRLRPPTSSSHDVARPAGRERAAVAGLRSSGLSQVTLVIASGSSCSQALLALRAVVELRAGRKTSSSSPARRRCAAAASAARLPGSSVEPRRAGSALPGRTPSCSTRFQRSLEVGLAEQRPPGLPHEVVARLVLAAREQAQHLDARSCRRRGAGSAAGRRSACRSSRGRRPRSRGSARCGHVPRRERRGLVDVAAEVDELLGLGRRGREVEVGGRVVGGVAAEDDERLHLAARGAPPTSSPRAAARRAAARPRARGSRRSSRRCRARR